MKLYQHQDGTRHFYPEQIPAGWEVLIRPDTFEVVWRRIKRHE